MHKHTPEEMKTKQTTKIQLAKEIQTRNCFIGIASIMHCVINLSDAHFWLAAVASLLSISPTLTHSLPLAISLLSQSSFAVHESSVRLAGCVPVCRRFISYGTTFIK